MKPMLSLTTWSRLKLRLGGRLGLAASILLAARMSFAQESLRSSLAGDAAAEAESQQIGAVRYTYAAGDFRLLVVPSVGIDFNDNINLSENAGESDFILRPQLGLTGAYPVTQNNLLSFSAGVGYDDYLEHSQYSTWRLTTGSWLSFDMYVKDFRLDFHDDFSAVEDPGAQAALAGTAQYGVFNNTSGLTATWDLEDVVLTFGYDHLISLATTGPFSYLDRSAELPLIRAGFRFDSRLTAGIEGSAAFTRYDQSVLNDNQNYSGGVYADWSPDESLHIQPRVGYGIYQFQHTSQSDQIYFLSPFIPSTTVQTADQNSWYADLSVSHQVTKLVGYGLSAGHKTQLGIQSDLVEDTYVRPNITWMLFKDLNLNTSFFYDHGNQGAGNLSGNFPETYDWYGGGFLLSYELMKRLLVSLNYRLTLRSSDVPQRGYAQNIVGIKFSYQPQ
jgi:hypothetical protein